MARPSTFSDKIATAICDRIANGESLREICRDETLPAKTTVMRWLADERFAAFRDQYAIAREAQADHFAEEIVEIADDATNDWMTRRHGDADEVRVPDHEHIQRSRLRVDARKWLMARLAPKKYGDRIEHAGEVGHRFVARLPEPVESIEDWFDRYQPERPDAEEPTQ